MIYNGWEGKLKQSWGSFCIDSFLFQVNCYDLIYSNWSWHWFCVLIPSVKFNLADAVWVYTTWKLESFSEREFNPRFINPNSLEFEWAKKWRDVFVEEEEKKAQLDEVMRDTRYRVGWLNSDADKLLKLIAYGHGY